MRKLRLTFLAALTAALGCAVPAGAGVLPPDLEQAAREWDAAQLHGDRAALERLLTEDYTLVNSQGVIKSKAEYIAEATSPAFKLQPFVIRQPIEKFWEGGAVRGGTVLASYTEDGQKHRLLLRFADVWTKRSGRWQVIYTGVTRVANTKD